MRENPATFALAAVLAVLPVLVTVSGAEASDGSYHGRAKDPSVQLGPRPFFLVEDMTVSPLKKKLQSCSEGPFHKSDFSIGHRGAALQFPEHTRESYEAGARMGAGILECDVTFTKDKELVCRHSQCDLHTTTNILATPLAAKCSVPFTPAEFDANGNRVKAASAMCCTSDITLAEFKTLRGKMDASNPNARTVAEYLGGTANFRTDLYAGPSSGTLVTHKESIELFKKLGVKMTPELKSPSVPMPFYGLTQEAYAQKMIDEYKAASVPPRNVFAQSFNLGDVLYWVRNEPAFGKQAVYLDDIDPTDSNPYNDVPKTLGEFRTLAAQGVKIVAPPMWTLLALDWKGDVVPSQYALDAKAAGLDIITWTLERSGILADGDGGWYYMTINPALKNEGATMEALHVLAKDVGILGIFSDWPATVTYYANCMGLD
jgi:glycerophosphoryl diester phosphodiesterase